MMIELIAGGAIGSACLYWASRLLRRRTHSGSRPIHARVVGVTFDGRQDVIERYVHAGDHLVLEPEPSNPADPNAVGVWTRRPRKQIGYLPRGLAATLKDEKGLTAEVVAVLGGGDLHSGVSIRIER